MKKFAVLLTITALLILTAACGKNTVNNKTVSKPDNTDSEVTELFNEDETKKDNGGRYITSSKYKQCYTSQAEEWVDVEASEAEIIAKYGEAEITTEKNESADTESGCAVLTVSKYRSCFYSVPAPFVELVGRDVWYEWMLTIDHTDKAEIMVMKQFIQEFDISREQFDKANLEFAKIIRDRMDSNPCVNPKDYANQIFDEIFNGDIIFTFDDEIINEYYLTPDFPYVYSLEYEEAVANGEYTSQTKEWVDIEAMEAEIIAKYGEAEIMS